MEVETKSLFFVGTCEHSLFVFSYLTNIIEVFIFFVDVGCSCIVWFLIISKDQCLFILYKVVLSFVMEIISGIFICLKRLNVYIIDFVSYYFQ